MPDDNSTKQLDLVTEIVAAYVGRNQTAAVNAGAKMHQRPGVKMHHDVAGSRSTAFLDRFDAVRLRRLTVGGFTSAAVAACFV